MSRGSDHGKGRHIGMNCPVRFVALAMAMVLGWSGTAHATDDSAKAAARELANQAKRDFDAGKFEEAGRKFQQAYVIAKAPTLALWSARSLLKQGQLVAASEFYRQATLLAPNDLWIGNAQQVAQDDARKELDELQPRIPKLRITVEGAEAKDVDLTVDDAKIPTAMLGVAIPTDPGRRHIVGKRGTEVVARTVEMSEGEHRETVLRFTIVTPSVPPPPVVAEVPPSPPPIAEQAASPPLVPAAAPPVAATAVVPELRHDVLATTPASTIPEAQTAASTGGAQQAWGWVTFSVGLAGLITGVVTGVGVMSKSGLRSDCPNGTCDPSKVSSSSVSNYNVLRDISIAGFIVGGVGTVLGVTLLLTSPSHESDAKVALWLAPTSAGVKGAF